MVWILLHILGHGPEYKDTMVEALPTLKERLKKNDPNVLFMVVKDLSKVINQISHLDNFSYFTLILLNE